VRLEMVRAFWKDTNAMPPPQQPLSPQGTRLRMTRVTL